MNAPDPQSLARLGEARGQDATPTPRRSRRESSRARRGMQPTLAALSLRARLRGDFESARARARAGSNTIRARRRCCSTSARRNEAAGESAQAEAALRAAIDADADNALARFWLGGVLQRDGRRDEAISAWL